MNKTVLELKKKVFISKEFCAGLREIVALVDEVVGLIPEDDDAVKRVENT